MTTSRSYEWALDIGTLNNRGSLQATIDRISFRISEARKEKRNLWLRSSRTEDIVMMTSMLTKYQEVINTLRKLQIFKAELEYLRDSI